MIYGHFLISCKAHIKSLNNNRICCIIILLFFGIAESECLNLLTHL